MSAEEHKRTDGRPWQKWAFAAIPAAGLLELGAHVAQTRSAATEGDWRAARDYVASQAKPEDLVAFAPRWADPVGREHFGPELATIEREARADETRFPRAFEVSIRGARVPELVSWHRAGARHFGGVTVAMLENPTPAHVLEDLVSMVGADRMHASRVEGGREAECSFARAYVTSGGLGFGPAVPADRFVCPGGGFVGVSVVADLEYRPHRCIYAPAPGGNGVARLRFAAVRFGRTLHGHHGLYVEAERDRKGPPVTITFKAGDAVLGSVVHNDGDGWKSFEFDTGELTGHAVDLVADIVAQSGERRMYCFEADTR